VVVPVPAVVTSPGFRVTVHDPVDGNPLSATLPVAIAHVGFVIVPATGVAGIALTVKVKVLVAAVHDDPLGLFVVTVIVIFFPESPLFGVKVNENGDTVAEVGLTEPLPFSVIVTFVAPPPNVFPETVTAVIPQVLPDVDERTNVGHWPNVFNVQNKNKKTMTETLVILLII
jgi:hypothetical protein